MTSQKSPYHLRTIARPPWNATIASGNANILLFFLPLSTLFSSFCIYLCPDQDCTLPPAGEVVTCPNGTFGTPPSCSCVEDNTAYFGNNARVGSSNPQPSRAACARSCREHPECQFWTWGKGSPMGPCYLKHSRDNVSPGLNSYVSGSKLCVLPEGGKPYMLILFLGSSIRHGVVYLVVVAHACISLNLAVFENLFFR